MSMTQVSAVTDSAKSATRPSATTEEGDHSSDASGTSMSQSMQLQRGYVLSERDTRGLEALHEFAQELSSKLELERKSHAATIDSLHDQFTAIISDLRQRHDDAARDAADARKRAEVAERKCELLSGKLASMITRRQDLEGDDMKFLTDRVATERTALLEALHELAGFAQVSDAVYHEIERQSSTPGITGVATTISDATTMLHCVTAELRRQGAARHAAINETMKSLTAAEEALAKCHVLASRKLQGGDMGWVPDDVSVAIDDLSTVGPASTRSRPLPLPLHSRGHRSGAHPSTLDFVGSVHSSRQPSARASEDGDRAGHGAETSVVDEHMVAAFQAFVTDSLVEMSRATDLLHSFEEAKAVDSRGEQTEVIVAQHQAALQRLSEQLRREFARHAETRRTRDAMLEAAEVAHVGLLRRLGEIESTSVQGGIADYRRALQAAEQSAAAIPPQSPTRPREASTSRRHASRSPSRLISPSV